MAGCTLDQPGLYPTPQTLNYPTELALSREPVPSHLFLINANFDLRFNQGTLQAFNLNVLGGSEPRTGMTPGGLLGDMDCTGDQPCSITDLSQFFEDEVGIGSQTDGIAVNAAGDRIYLANRSSKDLAFVDWKDDKFACGVDTSVPFPRCDDAHFHGATGTTATQRDLTLAGDPVAVVTGSLADVGGTADQGDYVLLALRDTSFTTQAGQQVAVGASSVALYVDQPAGGTIYGSPAPELVDIVPDLPTSLWSLNTQPGTGITWATSTVSNQLVRIGVIADPNDPTLSSIYDAGPRRVGGLDDGQDIRAMVFDPSAPESRAWILDRRPDLVATLDLARTGFEAGNVALGSVYDLGAGASRLARFEAGGRTYLLATCFDAKKVFVVDVGEGGLVSVVGGFSGPFGMAVDTARQLLYVTDFSLSVLRVIDLEPLTRFQAPSLIATLGVPTPVPTFAQ